MNDLVILSNGVPMVDSVLVAKKFNKVHRDLTRAIKNLGCSEEFSSRNFAHSTYEVRGKTFGKFMMTRDGFTILCMGLQGREAMKWKEAYIKAFNAMEKQLTKSNDSIEWKQARLQISEVRKTFTDTVSEFVKYATSQGSKSASRYYCNITKMEYSALELIEKGGKVPNNFRNTLDLMDLSFLTTAEQIARAAILDGMERGFPYKEIYLMAKEKVEQFASTVSFARLK